MSILYNLYSVANRSILKLYNPNVTVILKQTGTNIRKENDRSVSFMNIDGKFLNKVLPNRVQNIQTYIKARFSLCH